MLGDAPPIGTVRGAMHGAMHGAVGAGAASLGGAALGGSVLAGAALGAGALGGGIIAPGVAGLEPRDQAPPPNVVTITPGMTMAEIERAAIEAALRETRGNRRKAAEMLDIGERTLYRKLRDYGIAPDELAVAR